MNEPGRTAPRDKSRVEIALDGAKQNSSELHNVLSELAIRLAPVLTPDAEKTKNSVSAPTPVPTSIAEHIMLLTTSVMNAADRVHDIVGRLEI